MQLELTHENHFKFGFNDRWFNTRSQAEDVWKVEYGGCSYSPTSFRGECIEAAKKVRQATSSPIWVFMSGGCDSEIALRSFILAKIPVRAAIIRFKNDYNIHDISYAVLACEKNFVPYKFLELDIIDFFENKALGYAEKNRTVSAAMLPLMWGMDQIDGHVVIGSGECYLERKISDNGISWEMTEKERIAGLYRHLIRTNHPGAPGFFQYTPELMLAALKSSLMRKLCLNQTRYPSSMWIKNQLYYQEFANIIPRRKLTGYERVREVEAKLNVHLREVYADSDSIVWTEYNQLVSHLESSL